MDRYDQHIVDTIVAELEAKEAGMEGKSFRDVLLALRDGEEIRIMRQDGGDREDLYLEVLWNDGRPHPLEKRTMMTRRMVESATIDAGWYALEKSLDEIRTAMTEMLANERVGKVQ